MSQVLNSRLLRDRVVAFARKLDKQLFPTERGKARLAPSWRTVEHGILQGLQFFIPAGEGAPWADWIVAGKYEPRFIAALAEWAAQGGVLYDVGAHAGLYSCAWRRLGGGVVEAFEPLPSSARVVAETVERNELAGVRIHNFALGDFDGVVRLLADQSEPGAASMAFVEEFGGVEAQRESPQYRSARPLSAPVHTLDGLFENSQLPVPAVIKLDVEGAEARVLQGAGKLLAQTRPILLIEIHNIDAGLEITEQLVSMGYRFQILDKHYGMPATIWKPV
jgi:FkbM family methyltransferase